jgi:hypothetical protein
MTLVLDAGAFVAIERRDRVAEALVKAELVAGRAPVTHGGVIGQVWRGGAGKQARLAMLVSAVTIAPVDEHLGRRAGMLLKQTRTTDVIDAAVVLLAEDGDIILTSDPDDLEPLARAAGVHVDIVAL